MRAQTDVLLNTLAAPSKTSVTKAQLQVMNTAQLGKLKPTSIRVISVKVSRLDNVSTLNAYNNIYS